MRRMAGREPPPFLRHWAPAATTGGRLKPPVSCTILSTSTSCCICFPPENGQGHEQPRSASDEGIASATRPPCGAEASAPAPSQHHAHGDERADAALRASG